LNEIADCLRISVSRIGAPGDNNTSSPGRQIWYDRSEMDLRGGWLSPSVSCLPDLRLYAALVTSLCWVKWLFDVYSTRQLHAPAPLQKH